jgi:hypothetical protein
VDGPVSEPPLLRALADDLAERRAAAPPVASGHRTAPAKGDPFRDFAGFATQVLALDAPIAVTPGVTAADVRRTAEVELDGAFPAWRAGVEECAQALDLLASGAAGTVREVLMAFPVGRRRAVELGIVWMAKLGFVDWLT